MTGYRIIEVHRITNDTDAADLVEALIQDSQMPDIVASAKLDADDRAKADSHSTAWDEPALELPKRWLLAAPWRATVERRRSMLANDLARLDQLTKVQVRERDAMRILLKDAEEAIQEKVWLAKWWWGTEVERAWARLHEVEERTVDVIPCDELETRATDASAYAAQVFKSDDKRLVSFDGLRADVAAGKKKSEVLRPAIVGMLRAMHTQSDRDNVQARHLRNRLLLASSVCIFVTAGMLLIQRQLADFPFLVSKDVLSGRPTTYLFLVMTFGAVGALVTAIPSLSQIPSDFSPFNLPLQQAVLKIVLGPLVALLGFAIVGTIETTQAVNTEVLNIGTPTSLPAVLVLAVVFGAAQHLVTRFVDRRADEVLGALAPDKDAKT
jgi:hypothetical protein